MVRSSNSSGGSGGSNGRSSLWAGGGKEGVAAVTNQKQEQ